MLDRVRRTIAQHGLIPEGGKVLVAVSGGVDSMVLLHVLKELGHDLVVGHVDHHLRGAESDADRDFVMAHCAAIGVACHVRHVDPATFAERSGRSVQMAARDLRLLALREMAVEAGASAIATAHHADDALETLLLNLIRGTGVNGWASIPVIGNGFIRPMIEVPRQEIATHAIRNGIAFREDRSNRDPKYLRNRVRHELLPLMDALRPGATAAARRSAALLRDLVGVAGDALQADLGPALQVGGNVSLHRVLATGHPRLALQWLLRDQAPHPDVIDDLLAAITSGRHGARFDLAGGVLWVERDHLLLAAPAEPRPEVILADERDRADVPLRFRRRAGNQRTRSAGSACFDPAAVSFPMVLREWRAGDRMRPTGMTGSKLVSDILTDDKVDHAVRERALVLESGGRIIWLVGHRVDASAAVTDATREVLEVECTG